MSPSKVWSKFSSSKSDGRIVKFRIQDLPVDRWEEIIDFYLVNYVPEEAVHKAAGISKSLAAIAEYKKCWNERFEEESIGNYHIVVCSIDDGSEDVGEIIGVSVTELITETPDVRNLKFQTKEMLKFFEIVHEQESVYNIMEKHSLDRYHDDRGLAVRRDYRGLGIAREILKARRLSCIDRGEYMTGAWMTSIGTQKAAERDGWQTICEVSFEELGRKSGVKFEEATDTYKFMMWSQ